MKIIYLEEEHVLQLRNSINLDNNYLSKSSLLYILDAIKDLYNDEPIECALVKKAAYLLFNIINLHPFIDGNKRTAFGVADLFLRLNGYFIDIKPVYGMRFIVKVADGVYDEHKVRRWIKQHLKKLKC